MVRIVTDPDYGGRGIRVCHRWNESFEAFANDFWPRPSPELSLDRIDVNRGYECGSPSCCDCGPPKIPRNVRWATLEQQARNRRNNHIVRAFGAAAAAGGVGAPHGPLAASTLASRLDRGWSPEAAVSTPP